MHRGTGTPHNRRTVSNLGGGSGARSLERLVALCERDTTSGSEDRGLDALLGLFEPLGARIELQPVAAGRSNVLVTFGEPRVLFTTHLDTVPPFLPPAVEGNRLFGRGTADAKGQILCQFEALERLLQRGADGVAFLGLVGEETDAAGARAAGHFAERLASVRLIVNGEPTGLVAATGQRGFVHVELEARGRAAHSGSPELGASAIWPLLDTLGALRAEPAAVDAELGPEVWNLGRIDGGVAANVVPDRARAEVLCRALPGSRFLERLHALAEGRVEVRVLVDEPPHRYGRLAGLTYAPMPFGSDLPALATLLPSADVALVGPGSIHVAHTPEEHLDLDELAAGSSLLERLSLRYLSLPA